MISSVLSRISGIASAMLMCALLLPQQTLAAATAPKPVSFDHARTGFLLKDIHTTLRCEQCHVDGIFKNTPRACAGCHSAGSRVGATPKPVNHVQTNQACDVCHVSPTSFLVKSFNHVGITSGCASCHNGQFGGVVSKPLQHFPTSGPCESCHTSTTTFTSWNMNHAGITSGCALCHSGQFSRDIVSKPQPPLHISTSAPCEACHFSTSTFLGARFDHSTTTVAGVCNTCHGVQLGVMGKPANHIPTTAQCDVCHTAALSAGYTTFIGAKYDHITPPATNCAGCHTGQYLGAQGKPVNHLPSTAQCDTCHTNTLSYTTWLGATVAHTPTFLATGPCASCHNGITATGKAAFHIPTAGQDCGACHTSTNTNNYTTFFGATFAHVAITGRCDVCHNGISATGKGMTHVATTADCVTCHTQTNTANYTTFLGATYTHSPNPPTPGSCAACHNGATATGKPTWHMITMASCDQCHTAANTANYTTFLGATGADHTLMVPAAAGRCGSAGCHDGVGAKGLSTGHIPVAGLSCDSCHAVYNGTTVISFAGATMNHAVAAATRCDACHNGAYTTQGLMGAAGKVTNHIPTTITGALDCNTCHTTATYTTLSNWLTEKMNHNGAQGGGPVYCVTCHLSGTTFLGAMQKKSHQGTSVAKDCSKSGCHRPLGNTGAAYTRWK